VDRRTRCDLSDLHTERPEWTSYHRLVQDLISGVVRRHTFSQWELEFLLDLQNSRLRKSSRSSVLRKYLRTVHQHFIEGATHPPRLYEFLEREFQPRQVAAVGFDGSAILKE
jgi:hypothetical protein